MFNNGAETSAWRYRGLAYAAGAASASLFYVVWLVIEMRGPGIGLGFRIGLALFFWLVNGFAAALILMAVPWLLPVRMYVRVGWRAWIYFACAGAVLTFTIGCATASLSPKPMWIEDQTFLEGALIAANRQGLCLTLAGSIHGFVYWFIAEKKPARATQSLG